MICPSSMDFRETGYPGAVDSQMRASRRVGLPGGQRDEIIFAHALQDQEGERSRAAIRHEMRPPGPDGIDVTGLQPQFLLRVLQKQSHLAFEHVERVGDIGMGVPRHLLGRRELQLRDAKAGAGGMHRAALDVIEVTGVLDWLALLHVGLPGSSAPIAREQGAMLACFGRSRNCRVDFMGKRINRCIELLELDHAIYYDGPHSGHVLTHAQGRIDAATWADYMNVGMEHGAFDMAGLAEYLHGMVDAG